MKKILILMLAVVLATAMLVSCSDDSAYTEVLESDGAFSYNGKSYGSLEEVIVAISGSKAVNYDATTEFDHTITLTRDVVTRSAKIAVDGSIVLDLNGYTMNLEDASDAAIIVSNGTFCIKNGTVKMNDSSSTAALIKANNEARVEFQGNAIIVGNIAVDNNASVYSYDKAAFEGDVTLDGNASFSTYSAGNTTISTLTLPEGTSLNVGTTATVNGVDGDIKGDITAAEGAEITSDDESLDTELNENIVDGVYYVESSSGKIFYASIAKAIEQGETKITQLNNDENSINNLSADIEIVTSKNLTIDSITLSSGKTITLSGFGTVSTVKGSAAGTVAITGTTTVSEITGSKATVTVTGTKTAMPTIGNVDAAIFTAEYANINGDVETTGTQSYTNVVFGVEANEASDTAAIVPALTSTATKDPIIITDSTGTVGAVTAESSSITITDSRKSGNIFTTGTLSAKTVTVTGNEKVMPSIGGVAATSVEATYATIAGDVTTTGTQSYNNAVFKNEDVDLTSTATVIKDVQAAIVITNSTGTVGSIKTKAFEVSEDSAINSIVIDNSSVNAVLTVGTLEAYTEATEAYGDVIVTGAENYPVTVDNVAVADLTAKYATFTGDVNVANDVVSSGSKFTGIIRATNVIDGASDVGSEFSGVVNTTGTQSYNGSVFVDEPELTSTATELEEGSEAAIVITNSTGKVGSIKTEAFTYSDNGFYSIIINNSEASASLTTGMLSAYTSTTSNDDNNIEDVDSNIYGDISVTGKSSNRADVIVIGSMSNNFTVKYAQVSGEVNASSKLTSSYSLFRNANVHASVIYDGDKDDSASGSTLDGSTFYPGQIYLYYSEFTNESNIESDGSVYMVNVLGVAESIKSDSSDISIINEEATSLFTVGTINSDHKDNGIGGNVSVSGNASYLPVIGDVKAGSMMAEYSKITGTVDTKDNQSYLRTTFSGASELKSSEGSVYLEDVKGVVTKVEATTITIDNTKSVADFTTGTLSATGDITVTGNTSYKPTITHVEKAADLKVEYAKVVGEVSTSGTQVYANVEFVKKDDYAPALVSSATVIDDAAAIVIESSYGTVGDITANGTVENTEILAEGSSIKIDASAIEDLLSTGKLSAKTVEVVGNADYMPAIGGVHSEDKFEASYVKITGDVSTTGIQTYTNVEFADSPSLESKVDTIGYYDVAAIYISESIGDIGDITANHSIKIETSEKFDEKLTTGVLSAPTVTVIGKSKSKPAIHGVGDTTDSVVTEFVVNDAIIAGDVTTKGTQVYTNVEFVYTPALTSTIAESARDKATKAAIHIDNSIGTVGNITAEYSSVLIDASQINTLLSTGFLKALTVTINGNPGIMPIIGGVSGVNNFIVSDVTITGDVTTDGIQKYTNVEFENAPDLISNVDSIGIDDDAAIVIESSTGIVGDITAYYHSIKIDADGIKKNLITGKLSAATVTVNGYAEKMPTIGGIGSEDDLDVSYVIIAGDVSTTGLQKYTNVVFKGSPVLTTSISDSGFTKVADAAIHISKSIGTVGNIIAPNSSILVDASSISEKLSTGKLSAKKVNVVGNTGIRPSVGGVGVEAATTDFAVSNAIIAGNVTTSGIQEYTNVVFENTPILVSTIADANLPRGVHEAIYIGNSTGSVGSITATNSSIKIDASGIDDLLSTGELTAKTVEFIGNPEVMPSIGGLSGLTNFVVSDVTITGNVSTSGVQSYTNVEFKNAPSLVSSATAISADAEAAIVIKNSYGTVGAVTAESSSVTITDSRKSGNILTTGKLTAKTVTVTGNEKVMPSIGGVAATSVEATYATIAGDVTTTDIQSYNKAVFKNEGVDLTSTEATIVISNSTGTVGSITTSGSLITIDNSKAKSVLTINGMMIDGSAENRAITVTGNSSAMVSIGSVNNTTSLNIAYVTIATIYSVNPDNPDIPECAVTSRNSVFKQAINVVSIEDGVLGTAGTGSKFYGAINTTGSQIYHYSEFMATSITSKSSVTLDNVSSVISSVNTNGKSIIVDQTNAKSKLYIGNINTIKDENNRGDVTIISSSTANVITQVGKIVGGNVTLTDSRALAGSNSATLIIDGYDSIKAYGTLNIYGGKYGVASGGIDFGSGSEYNKTINIYMGTFYVDNDSNFQKVAENLRYYNVNNYYGFVEILLNKNITLDSEVQIGGWEDTTDKFIGNKSVLIAGSNDIRKITIPFCYATTKSSINYSLHFHSGIYVLRDLMLYGELTNSLADTSNDYYYHGGNTFVSIVVEGRNKASYSTAGTFRNEGLAVTR